MRNRYALVQLAQAYLRQMTNRPCADCGGTFPYWVMEFDHVRGEKLFNVTEATLWLFSHHHPEVRAHRMQQLHDEVAKCDIVCANCHLTRTHMRSELGRPMGKKRPRFKPFGTSKAQLKKYGRAKRTTGA